MKRKRSQRSTREAGNALAETLISLLAFAPFIAAIPLLGKQADIKQKTFDAARYTVWEKIVWRSSGTANRKSEAQLTLEVRDRIAGDPHVGMMDVDSLSLAGITENPLWRDARGERLVDYDQDPAGIAIDFNETPSPVEVGYFLVPGVSYGEGPISALADVLQVEDLSFSRRTFASSALALPVRPVVSEAARTHAALGEQQPTPRDRQPLIQRASSAILSDTWSSADEDDFRRRVDRVTTDELIAALEMPARPIGSMAQGKGQLLYGEGQFAWDPNLQPDSSRLPRAYVRSE